MNPLLFCSLCLTLAPCPLSLSLSPSCCRRIQMCVFPITGTLCCFTALGSVGCTQGHLLSIGKGSCSQPHPLESACPQAGYLQGAGTRDTSRVAVSTWAWGRTQRDQCPPHLLCQGPSPHRDSFLHAVMMFPVTAAAASAFAEAQHDAWAAWHGALLMEGCVMRTRRVLSVDEHYCPILP